MLIKNDRENKTYAQVFATNAFHVKAKGKTQVLFRESPAGQPAILRAWFYPGDAIMGSRFVAIKKDRAAEIKRAPKSGEEVPVEEDPRSAVAARTVGWQCAEVLSTASLRAKANVAGSVVQSAVIKTIRVDPVPVERSQMTRPRALWSRRPVPLRRWSAA